jgi:hypothetical protein
LPSEEATWRSRLRALQTRTVTSLLALARDDADRKIPCYGVIARALRDVLERDPSNEIALRLLGYVRLKDGVWATIPASALLDRGFVQHPVFGWVESSWIERLDAGELPGRAEGGRAPTWLPAAEADAQRAGAIENGWQISTAPHFEVRTNATLAEGVDLARRLEALHDSFEILLGDVIGRDRLPLAQRLDGSSAPPLPSSRKHQVWYFAQREDYITFFRRFGQDESVSLGYYMPAAEARRRRLPGPRAYFFRDPGGEIEAQATLFHEASHQVLFERAGPTQMDRNISHFWVWEGLGTYFETLTPRPDIDGYEIGGWIGPRLEYARKCLLDDRQGVPIRDFVRLSRDQFNQEPRVYLHYAQSMALVVFFMHGENGRFREPFLDYVAKAYRGLARGDLFEQTLGIPADEIDRRFLAYVRTASAKPE